MRNLKKALALVLALMMALSLMVTVSASDYADDSAIEQDEAISVMSALGVFNGTDGGMFDPEGNLTRAQAAKIITYMLLDKKVADSLPNTGSKFADCPDGRWYVGSVNYLTDLGIVAGRNETTFDPNGNVNGYEFAKMLLGALGYSSKTERFEGDSAWSINIATAARRAGLDEGLAVSAISSVALTREQAAKLAFNTLTADMVYYEGGVVVGEVTVNPTRKEVANAATGHYDQRDTATPDRLMQFCEQYYPELKLQDYAEADDFGHTPSGRWVYGKTNAYVNLAEPTLVLTEGVNEAGLTKLLPKGVKASAVEIKGNNNSDTAPAGNKTLAQIAALTADGKQVEIYVNGDTKEIEKVITTTYKVETVTSITEKNGATTYKFSKTGGNKVNNDDKTEVVLAGEVAKDDVVTTTIANGKVYVYPTAKFSGSQTAKKGTTVTIGGAQYDIGTGVAEVTAADFANSKDEANYWTDMNGYLVKVEGITTEQDYNYAIITNAIWGGTSSLDNGVSYTINVRAVLDDGSVMDATLKLDKAESTNNVKCGDVDFGKAVLDDTAVKTTLGTTSDATNKVFGYYMDDGIMVLKDVGAATTGMTADTVYQQTIGSTPYKGETSLTNDSITALFNSKTVFVIYNKDGNKVTAETHTGTAGLAINKTTGVADGKIVMSATAAAQGTASVVFLKTATVAPTVDYVYIDVSAPESVLKDDGSGSVWKYTGITPEGEEIDVFTSNTTALTKDGLYEYDADKVVNSTAKIDVSGDDSGAQFANVTNAQTNEELVKVGSSWIPTDENTNVIYLDDLESIAGNNCLVEIKDGKIVTIFVYACQHTATSWSKAQAASAVDAAVEYASGDHIQTCTQCSKVIDKHAAPVCTSTSDNHSETNATVNCTVEGCTVNETCNVDHTAGG